VLRVLGVLGVLGVLVGAGSAGCPTDEARPEGRAYIPPALGPRRATRYLFA